MRRLTIISHALGIFVGFSVAFLYLITIPYAMSVAKITESDLSVGATQTDLCSFALNNSASLQVSGRMQFVKRDYKRLSTVLFGFDMKLASYASRFAFATILLSNVGMGLSIWQATYFVIAGAPSAGASVYPHWLISKGCYCRFSCTWTSFMRT